MPAYTAMAGRSLAMAGRWRAGTRCPASHHDPWNRASKDIHKGKQQRKVKARSLFCFWPACAGTADRAVSELGMSLRELARRLEMSSPGVGFSVERGETIARENGLQLIE